jgi:hypothetical protein
MNENVITDPNPSMQPQQFALNATTSAFTACVYFKRPLIGIVGSSRLYNGLQSSLFSPTGSKFFLPNLIVFAHASKLGMNFQPKFFQTEKELEDYASARNYETDGYPGLCAAIVINDLPNGYSVKLRYDDNNYESDGSTKQEIPTTRKEAVTPLARYLRKF